MGSDKLSSTSLTDLIVIAANNLVKIDPETRPAQIGAPFTGHYRTMLDTPKGLTPGFPKPEPSAAGTIYSSKELAERNTNIEGIRSVYDKTSKEVTKSSETNGDTTKALEEITKESKKLAYCYSCGIDCTRVRYHFKRDKSQYDMCPECYREHRYPVDNMSHEFVKQEDENYSRIPDRDAAWSDKELLLLLEKLSEDTDNWDEISDYVGTRTREECVVKFLQLEIEDKYLENEPESFGVLDQGRVPFNQADNPVMSVVSFLAGMADPSVAAATAGRWVDETRKNLQKRLEGGLGGESEKSAGRPGEKGKAPESVKPESTPGAPNDNAMDIDPTSSPRASDPNALATQGTPQTSEAKPANPLPTLALAASAARASSLASHEEREMTRLVSTAVNASLEKMELKMKHFAEMEALLQQERKELERGRRELFLERVALRKRVEGFEREGKMSEEGRLGFENGNGNSASNAGMESGEGTKGWRKFEM